MCYLFDIVILVYEGRACSSIHNGCRLQINKCLSVPNLHNDVHNAAYCMSVLSSHPFEKRYRVFKPAITNVFMALVVHRCSSSSSCWQTLSTLLCRPTYCLPAWPKRERSDLSREPSSPLKSKIRRTERHITGLWRNSGTVSSNNKKLMPWYRSI